MASKAKIISTDSVDKTGRPWSSYRRRLVRMLCWFVAIALGLYALSNLWLWSAWGTNTVETELKSRTGQDWEIGSMSWSPWNGISLYDARMLQPNELRNQLDQPVMAVKKIRVRPYWRQLARGRVYPKNVEIDSPNLHVSLEMLAAIASRTVNPTEQKTASPPRLAKPNVPKPPKAAPDKTLPKPAPSQKKTPPKPTPPAAEQTRVPLELPIHLKITNARCRLVSISKQFDLLDINELDYEHILLGKDTEGTINIRSVNILGLAELSDIQQKLLWKRPYLELEQQAIDLGGVSLKTRAQLVLGKNRSGSLPFLMELAVDHQKIKSAQWLDYVGMVVDADSAACKIRLRGILNQPDSWRADGIVAANQLSVRERHGNHDVVFEELYLPFIFRQGALRWSQARLISEDLAIMGNGVISLRDGHLSVTRVITSPEAASYLLRAIHGSHLFRNPGRWWADLDTPERVMRDLVVTGPLLAPEIDAGANYTNLPLIQVVTTVYNFIREEMREAGKELKALPSPQQPNNNPAKP